MPKILLKKNEDRRILSGHRWVFSNEIDSIDGEIESGEIVEVYNSKRELIGNGFFNNSSLIAARLLGKSYSGDLGIYITDSIRGAYEYRKEVYPDRNSFRMVFSESDDLPGLIIDKYNDTYVLQAYCFGMQKNIQFVTDFLKNEFQARNIFSRNEPYFRKLEGLPEENELYLGEIGSETISDGKILYSIDFSQPQKTGFFFDQCDNREFAERFVSGKTVLDAFCNSGGFGMHAAFAGAGFVTFVDSSAPAIENAKSNYALNKLSAETEFIESDVFDYLEKCVSAGRKFDVVILDPPAFAKSRKSFPTALKGYTKLNRLALMCVKDGGTLITSSCSHHVKDADFLDAVNKGSQKAVKQLQLIYNNGASLDHPQLPAMEETAYLKFMIFRVFSR